MKPPAPAQLPGAGAGLPAGAYDVLHALADEWEADMPGHAHYAAHWHLRGDGLREGMATGRVRQLNACAVALRNALNDLMKEST